MKKLVVLTILSLIIVLSACGFETTNIEESYQDQFKDCDSIIYHTIEYSVEGVYVSEDGDAFRVTMDYEDQNIFFENDYLSARDIGMLAYLSYKVYAKKGYPNADLVKEKLQNILVVVTNTEEELAKLYVPKIYNIDPSAALEEVGKIGAFVNSTKPECYADIPEEADISFFIRDWNLLGAETSIHELMHPVGWYGFGDVDSDHDDKRLWAGLDDNSIAADVLRLWKYTNGL